jgi:hypothetical protein
VRLGWGLTAVTALAIQVIRPWATQLRGDFFAIALNVTSLVLIAGEGRTPMLLAALGGIAAGLAPCIKLSYVAGAVSGVIWLLWERQWRRAFIFMTAGGITAVTIYGVTGWYEPLLWLHMTMLRKAVLPDHAGQLALFLAILRDPLIVVALTTGVTFGRWWRRSRCCLLLIYIIITTCIAITTSAHAGANLNYYLEPSMALMPLTVVGGLCLWRFAGRPASSSGRVRMVLWSGVALAMALGILPWCVQEMASLSASQRRIEARNQRFNRLRQLRGLRILSFSPDATLATAAAQIEDPWALSLFSIRGIIRLDPLVDRIVAKEFDVVIIDRQHTGYRGVPTIAAELGVVISKHYVPKCEVLGAVVCVRRPAGSRGDIRIAEGIRKVGCL